MNWSSGKDYAYIEFNTKRKIFETINQLRQI